MVAKLCSTRNCTSGDKQGWAKVWNIFNLEVRRKLHHTLSKPASVNTVLKIFTDKHRPSSTVKAPSPQARSADSQGCSRVDRCAAKQSPPSPSCDSA